MVFGNNDIRRAATSRGTAFFLFFIFFGVDALYIV